ncbi:copper oxidase [Brevibacillus parabrevis]|uniref:multicopper oxidase family protein n=1 Tax=Brevibacillus parabrevis TaxID=54914 RepID=UPI0007ABEA04|nr:multicopper oxidase family protein [Brevibacillus parabrevis]KZE43128.1 copper oxidase [Brevibacillus parabrevis]
MKTKMTTIAVFIVVVLSVYLLGFKTNLESTHTTLHEPTATHQMEMDLNNSKSTPITSLTAPERNGPVKTFNLTAQISDINLGNGKTIQAWTYNGTSPGPEIRVKQGDRVVVNLINKLPVSLTIHWHGIDIDAAVDGVAGVTQDAVKPGETYTYAFNADQLGTYWYHSHQNSALQTERGLFGSIIVEPAQPKVIYDKDYAIALHEWDTKEGNNKLKDNDKKNDSNKFDNRNEKDDDSTQFDQKRWNESQNEKASKESTDLTSLKTVLNQKQMEALSDRNNYDVYTLNGTSEGLHLDAKAGDLVRLRLINTGNETHLMTLPGVPFQVIALDGRNLIGGTSIDNTILPIGPAQRYDISFRMPQKGSVKLVNVDPSKLANQMLSATIGTGEPIAIETDLRSFKWFDFTKYGTSQKGMFSMDSKFTKTYEMDLSEGLGLLNGQKDWVYTINGKAAPDIPPIEMKQGDSVKVVFRNKGEDIHPMHLHGHTFQVISKNGMPLEGSPVYLDTLNIFPDETYEIAMKANNPGLWMLHCHNLKHAANGMHTMMNYDGITTPFMIGDHSGNHPE